MANNDYDKFKSYLNEDDEENNNSNNTKNSKNGTSAFKIILSSVLTTLITAIILFLLFIFLVGQSGVLDMKTSNTTSTLPDISNASENEINTIYNDNIDGVISVLNLKDVSSASDLLNKYYGSENVPDSIEQSVGSGFVYKDDSEDGYYYAVTNNHVVDGSDSLQIVLNDSDLKNDDPIEAKLVGTNEQYDVAVIKFKSDKDIKPLKFGDSDQVTPGDDAIAIGSPYGTDFQGSVTSGIVSAPIRTYTDPTTNDKMEYIQTDAAINPGNSGGPLLNSKGEVIGMNSLKIADTESDNIGFAIPSNEVQTLIKQIEDGDSDTKSSSKNADADDSSSSSNDNSDDDSNDIVIRRGNNDSSSNGLFN